MKRIAILNGSPRRNGKTASLVKAFTEDATEAGNEVKELYLQGMNIGGCLACANCATDRTVLRSKTDAERSERTP